MRYYILKVFVFALTVSLMPSFLMAQGGGIGGGGFGGGGFGGGAAGAAYNAYQNQPMAWPQTTYANPSEFIAVKGSAELAVNPESIRLVFAVTSEADSSLECSAKVQGAIKAIQADLKKMGIQGDRVVEDFIVILPSYIWELKDILKNGKEDRKYLKERQKGFRMQTNLHILCKTEVQANEVMQVAFRQGVTEIISFDYWHPELDRFKKEALKKAVETAKDKSDILLSLFDQKPAIMNINNSTKISFPATLYKTLQPVPYDESALIPYNWNNSYLKIRAFRPKSTFYAGSQEYADIAGVGQPMNPKIIIRSEVTLTYESPARKQRLQIELERAKNQPKD